MPAQLTLNMFMMRTEPTMKNVITTINSPFKMMSKTSFLLVMVASLAFTACREMPSKKPAIHPNQNMDYQPKFKAQAPNPFFEDNRAMRLPVEGTVARGNLRLDSKLFEGKDEKGNFVTTIPVNVDLAFINRGRDRYNIFCTPCHGGTGDGKGLVVPYGLVPPPSYHDERILKESDGYLYDVITNGVRTMYGYKSQIPVEDRWAIVAYVRALQKSQNASKADLKGHTFTQAEIEAARQAKADS